MKIKKDFVLKDNHEKSELIRSFNFYDVEDYEDKWELICEVIQNVNEYDLIRIQALKFIEVASIPDDISNKVCNLILDLLKNEEDYDVRNYAFIASRNLVNKNLDIKNFVSKIVLLKEEDIDIRHGAFAAVLRISNKSEKTEILKTFLNDDEFSSSAKRAIGENS